MSVCWLLGVNWIWGVWSMPDLCSAVFRLQSLPVVSLFTPPRPNKPLRASQRPDTRLLELVSRSASNKLFCPGQLTFPSHV